MKLKHLACESLESRTPLAADMVGLAEITDLAIEPPGFAPSQEIEWRSQAAEEWSQRTPREGGRPGVAELLRRPLQPNDQSHDWQETRASLRRAVNADVVASSRVTETLTVVASPVASEPRTVSAPLSSVDPGELRGVGLPDPVVASNAPAPPEGAYGPTPVAPASPPTIGPMASAAARVTTVVNFTEEAGPSATNTTPDRTALDPAEPVPTQAAVAPPYEEAPRGESRSAIDPFASLPAADAVEGEETAPIAQGEGADPWSEEIAEVDELLDELYVAPSHELVADAPPQPSEESGANSSELSRMVLLPLGQQVVDDVAALDAAFGEDGLFEIEVEMTPAVAVAQTFDYGKVVFTKEDRPTGGTAAAIRSAVERVGAAPEEATVGARASVSFALIAAGLAGARSYHRSADASQRRRPAPSDQRSR